MSIPLILMAFQLKQKAHRQDTAVRIAGTFRKCVRGPNSLISNLKEV